MKVKICQIVSSDMTLRFMLLNQLRFLQQEGYQVYAVSSPGKWVDFIRKEGITVIPMPIKRKMSPMADIVFFFRLLSLFRKERFDIVHTHTLKAEFFGQLAAKLAGVPIILNTLHGFDFRESDSGLKKKLFLTLERIAAYCSTAIFSISKTIIVEAIREKIASGKQFFYLGRDIDTDRFNPAIYSPEWVAQQKVALGIAAKGPVIGIIARLVEEKGFLELFSAFKTILKRFPDATLLIVGPHEPEKKDALSAESVKKYGIENNTIFLGEREDTESLYPVMDIFALPTHREGLGATLLEASAMEKPIVSCDIGGVPEAVEHQKTGTLVPVKDSERLAEAILYLLENPVIAKQMGQEGRKKVVSEFSSKIVLGRLGKAYRALMQKHLLAGLENNWLEKYSGAAKAGKTEHEIMFHSKTGFDNDNRFFFDYFKKHISQASQEKQKVLDVGCGFGDSLQPLEKAGFSCYGVDYTAEVIEIARKKEENKGIVLQVADIYALPFVDESFDFVICKGVFQVVSDVPRALQELKRVLKKGGVLTVVTLNGFSVDRFLQKEKIRRYNPYAFRKMLALEGFDPAFPKGSYIMPQPLVQLAKLMITLKFHHILNLIFPVSLLFAHNFYIESKKRP